MPPLDSFLLAVRQCLNRDRATRALLWAVTAGAGTLLAVALIFVFRGYEVPRYWYGIALAATLAGARIAAVMRRATVAEASEFADGFFHLNDTIVSRRRFEAEHKTGGYYDLQAQQTEDAVRPLDAKSVPFVWPQKLAAAACVLTMACVLTAFKSTDQKILDRIEQERLTQFRMEEIKEELKKLIEELEKSADSGEEKKALDPDQLREFVKQLESTKEMAEALKQLANLERKLDNAANALDQKRNEQLMKKVGEELEKEEDPQARELAKKLKNEQFKDAAKDLEKMKPEDAKLPKDKQLSEKRKEAAKLKAAAKRMAAAARQQKGSQSKNSNEGDENDGKSQTAQMSKAEEQDDELAEELEKLEMEADEYDQDMEELEEGGKLGKIDLSKLEKSDQDGEKLRVRMDKLGKGLNKMGLKSDAKKKLLSMSRKAGQSQGYLQGLAQSPFSSRGGLKPGDGTAESSRDKKDKLEDNGNTTQLKGQKGAGPSITKIEAADDGTGVSRLKAEAKERAFKKQFESFVQREDVPEDVKDGVKQYFESLHFAEPGGNPADGK